MEKSPPPPSPAQTFDSLGRAKQLAEKMAKVLSHEEVADVSIAVALLTSGVIHQYADSAAKAHELIESIRRLEDWFIAKFLDSGDMRLQ
jgi:hypothetical protein